MRKILLYGNCHMKSIDIILKSSIEFNEKYETKIMTVHEASDDILNHLFEYKEGYDYLGNYDIIIYMFINDNYRNLNVGSNRITKFPNIHKIRIVNAYYTGYFPELSNLYTLDGKQVVPEGTNYNKIIYHDSNIFCKWMENVGGIKNDFLNKYIKDIFPIHDENFYKKEISYQEHNISIAKLSWREDIFKTNVKITDYIKHTYNKKRLFHTFNHPSLDIFIEECRQISSLLDISQSYLDNVSPKLDIMNFTIMPIYSSTHKNLKLEFPINHDYKHNNNIYSPTQMNDIYYDIFLNLDSDIRDHNLKRIIDNQIKPWY